MTYSLSPLMYGANATSCIPITVSFIISVESALLTNIPGRPQETKSACGCAPISWRVTFLERFVPYFTFDLESNDRQSWPLIRHAGNPLKLIQSLATIYDFTSTTPCVKTVQRRVRETAGFRKLSSRDASCVHEAR